MFPNFLPRELPSPRIAVLATYLDLYNRAYPNYKEKMHDFVTKQLSHISNIAQVDSLAITSNLNDAKTNISLAETRAVDAIVLISAGYTNSLSVTPALCETKLPIIILNIQETSQVSPQFSFEDLLYNHGMQGVQDICAVLVRENKSFFIVTGVLQEKQTTQRLRDYLLACQALRLLKGARIGILTPPQWGMGDGLVEPSLVQTSFGIQVINIPNTALSEFLSEVTPNEIEEIRQFDTENFEISPDVTPEDHIRSIKLEIALRKLVAHYRLVGLTLSFDHVLELPGIDTMPFHGIVKLMGEGIGYGGEGDLLVTVWTAITQLLSPPASFTEMYTMDFTDNTVLCTHMAELNWRLARKNKKPILISQTFSLAPCKPFCSLLFNLEPGPATLSAFTLTHENQFHIISLDCQIMDFPLLTRDWKRPNYKIGFAQDIRQIMDEYAYAGGPHHLSISPGLHAQRYQAFAQLSQCKFTKINTSNYSLDEPQL